MEIMWRVISREGEGIMGEKVQRIRSINSRYKTDKKRLRKIQEI